MHLFAIQHILNGNSCLCHLLDKYRSSGHGHTHTRIRNKMASGNILSLGKIVRNYQHVESVVQSCNLPLSWDLLIESVLILPDTN